MQGEIWMLLSYLICRLFFVLVILDSYHVTVQEMPPPPTPLLFLCSMQDAGSHDLPTPAQLRRLHLQRDVQRDQAQGKWRGAYLKWRHVLCVQ